MRDFAKFKIASWQALWAALLAPMLFSCDPHPEQAQQSGSQTYVGLIIALDTLSTQDRVLQTDSVLAGLWARHDTASLAYLYLKGYNLLQKGKPDSASLYFERMRPEPESAFALLREHAILQRAVGDESKISPELVDRIYSGAQLAEDTHGWIAHRFYDLIARTYFINQHTAKAKEYSDRYYESHPFKNSTFVRQRYYDISFLLAERMGDTAAMRQSIADGRLLATELDDSTALMRTYEAEAQLQARQGQYVAAIENQKRYFRHLEQNSRLGPFAFNNLANLYRRSQQPDSAIAYANRGIAWATERGADADLYGIYGVMRQAYEDKGDFRKAYMALDSAFKYYHLNTIKVQAAKVAEIHAQYETEKKDNTIQALQTTNALNSQLIAQQRWMFVVVLLLTAALGLFAYTTYRRRILLARNQQLEAENRSLQLEQKTRQMQLNPHFVYNAIANLQGLISNGQKEDANSYLVAFSKLVRNVLELNRQEYITLAEEIGSLDNYLRLQRMRYGGNFAYEIRVADTLDTEQCIIPPMIIQPFVENAIEHGFKNIAYEGRLDVDIRAEGDTLKIRVADNGSGVGSQAPAGKKSLSRSITQERLDLIFNLNGQRKAYFDAKPIAEAGKTGYVVDVTLPLLTD